MKKVIGGYMTTKGKTVCRSESDPRVWIVRDDDAPSSYWLFSYLRDVRLWEAEGEPEVFALAFW